MTPDTIHLVTSVLAVLAAMQFAGGTLLVKCGLERMDSMTGAVVSIGTSTMLYVLAARFTIEAEYWRSPAVYIFALIGVLRPAFSTMLAYEGTRRLGPTISATVASLSPAFAVAGGVLLLHEQTTRYTLAGTTGVILGIMVLSGKGKLPRTWPLWALLFPLGAALIRSMAHVAARLGLMILPSVVMSGLLAYSVSFTIAFSVRFLRGPGGGGALSLRGGAWFVAAGLFNGGAIFCLNTALKLGEVVVVSPLAATYPLFTLLGSWLFLRQEAITGRTVLGVLLCVPSAILLTLGH